MGWWVKSFVLDYALLFAIGIALLLVSLEATPRVRYQPSEDPTFTYPLIQPTFPTWLLLLISILGPLLFMALAILFSAKSESRSRKTHRVHHFILGLLFAVALTLLITECLKVGVGRLRPDFDARITPEAIIIGKRSWPSGHASLSFCGMTYLSLFLAFRFKVWEKPLIAAFGSLLPLGMALWISASRIYEYYHHPSDVSFGCLLGVSSAVISWFLVHTLQGEPRERGTPIERLLVA